MKPINIAMRLLKMPIVDTKIPGLRMAYGDDEETMNTPMMGESPAGGKVIDMSPNEYFDIVGEDAEKHNEPIVPDRDAEYRWIGRRFGPEGGSEQNIARIIEGIKENKVMGAPVLHFNQDKYTGVQEGGHRMEALRQMGHGDTQVPIVTYNTNYEKGSPMDRAMQFFKAPQEAKDYATQIHEGQMYGEQPYMTHVEDVASGFDDPHLQRIAYLHDTVEDSETGIGEIHERFGEDVGHAVDALTRRQGEQYFDYINRVKEHPEATQVKLADLHSNLKNNPNESLARRYQKAIGILTNKSEPMDIAMRLLKRQTELGEFHPDLPSSHGEVKWLHGTPETNVDSIRRLGVLPNDGSDWGHGAFVTDNPMSASGYVKNAPVAYIGVREGAGEPEPRVTPSLATQAFPEGIPPQFLTVMPKSPFTQDMYRADALGQEQFRLPAENVRLRNYFDRMTGDNQYELQRIQDMGRTIDERGAEHVV